MAERIQDPGVGTALQRLFRLQGRVRPALEEFVVPTVLVGDVSQSGPPGVRRIAQAQFQQGAVVAAFPTFLFRCPAGLQCVIEQVTVRCASACDLLVNTGLAGATTIASVAEKAFVDQRIGEGTTSQQPAAVVLFGTEAALFGNAIWRTRLEADVARDLFPGYALGRFTVAQNVEFQFTASNAVASASIEWTEYPLV